MLKKLQSLLFEEEEYDDAGETQKEEPVQVQTPAPAPAPAPEPVKPAEPVIAPAPAPAPEPVKPAMQRIDVTQSIPVQEPKRPQTPRNESVFREPEQAKPSVSLGITADGEKKPERRPAPKPAKPAARPTRREEKPSRPAYQFQPVISPIFGVDEKDMNALKTTTSKISEAEKAKTDKNVTPIISPMYGMNAEDVPSSIQKTVEKSNQQEQLRVTPEKIAAEEEIPEFSLDDILKVRDEEYTEEQEDTAETADDTAPLFPDLNLWDDEPENFEDQTIVIERREDAES